jgi:Holliday junction resolvase RusA-like endonuclease
VTEPTIAFAVRGLPVPQGALVRSPSGGLYHRGRQALGDWRHAIGTDCRRAMSGLPAFGGPIRVYVTFFLPRPKGHFRADGETLRPTSPAFPAGRPDVDKLARACLDALTAVAFDDDAQVVELVAVKEYAGNVPVGAVIEITELGRMTPERTPERSPE